MIRSIPIGVYTATARLVLPGGHTRQLNLREDTRPQFSWLPSLTVTWTMSRNTGLLTMPILYVGQ
jgi:hypothetical protein